MTGRVSAATPPQAPRSHRRESALAGLLRRDPRRIVLHRAVRITLAACVAFYTCRFLVGDPQMAVYSCFAAISLGALSNIAGTARQRLRLYVFALIASWVLVIVGTWAAANIWAASVGMLVVGFAVSYIAIGGPRLAGVSSGLLLMYILPSFPPYTPSALDSRLIGVTLGTVLIAAADRWLWPVPDSQPYELRLATTADALAEYLQTMRPLLGGSVVRADELAAARKRAVGAGRASAPTSLPPQERPAGPFRHDRSMVACGSLLRLLISRTYAVEEALRRPDAPDGPRRGAFLLDAVEAAVEECAAALAGAGPAPDAEPVRAANRRHAELRLSWLRDIVREDSAIEARLRLGSTLSELGETADFVVQSVRLVCRATTSGQPGAAPLPRSSPLWFADRSTLLLWWIRARGLLTPRSVVFQNALRLALGLAAARFLAGSFDLSHGFWVLLATLTLMRTTATATRSALWPAFLGTVAGALTAAGLLLAFGQEPAVFVIVLPVVLIAAFAVGPLAGPVLGPAGGQFFFTLAVAALFIQVAPADWRLAEARLLDVVLGGVVGSIVGVLVWPSGGTGELRRAAEGTLRSMGEHILTTARSMAGLPSADVETTLRQVRHNLILATDSLIQSFSEDSNERDPDRWQAFLVAGHRTLHGSFVLQQRYPTPGPLPWPGMTALLLEVANGTSRTAQEVADEISAAHVVDLPPVEGQDDQVWRWLVDTVRTADPTVDSLRVLDTRAWMLDVDRDLREIVASTPSD
ncbi:MAG TPA: FUSC family protein [Actinomycetes bacterium]|nr:FUSC family protein [Actinomycetes bacterium]